MIEALTFWNVVGLVLIVAAWVSVFVVARILRRAP